MFLSAYLVCAFRNGGTLVVDELERSLHPMLVDYLVGLVQDSDSNPAVHSCCSRPMIPG